MAVPGAGSRDIPLRVTEEGDAAIESEAIRLNVKKNDIVRMALAAYFKQQGRTIEFSPRPGGKRTRMTEQTVFNRVMRRVEALGLPEPQTEYQLKRKTYDLAWPDRRVAVEIANQKKPADTNDWIVGVVRTTMDDDQIDAVLRSLPL